MGGLALAILFAVSSTVVAIRGSSGKQRLESNLLLAALLVAIYGGLVSVVVPVNWTPGNQNSLLGHSLAWAGGGLISGALAWLGVGLIAVFFMFVIGLLLATFHFLFDCLPDDERLTYTTWKLKSGYKWLNDNEDDDCVIWSPGVFHDTHKNVVAGSEKGKWLPAAGYKWVDAAKKDFKVVWMPGSKATVLPNVQADAEEGFWIPAPGYKWLDSSGDRFEVVPIVQKSAEHAHQ